MPCADSRDAVILNFSVEFSMARFIEQVQAAIRVRQYSLATERSYLQWVRRFILFNGKRHPAEMGKLEVEAFLTYLAVRRGVSPSTQNEALQALLFLYRNVLEVELPRLDNVVRDKPRRRVKPVRRDPRWMRNHMDRVVLTCHDSSCQFVRMARIKIRSKGEQRAWEALSGLGSRIKSGMTRA